jgi:hypothetical protein
MRRKQSARHGSDAEREGTEVGPDDDKSPSGVKQSRGKNDFNLERDRWHRVLWCQQALTTPQRDVLLLILHRFVNRQVFQKTRELEWWPSQQTLAEILSVNSKQISAVLRQLEEKRVIQCLRHGGKGHGSNRYRLLSKWLRETETALAQGKRLWRDDRLPDPEEPASHIADAGPAKTGPDTQDADPEKTGPDTALQRDQIPRCSGTLPSRRTSKTYPSDEKGSAAASSEKEKQTETDLDPLALERHLTKLRSYRYLKPDERFKLFLDLYPTDDRNKDKLHGAWINAVVKSKANDLAVLVAALAWKMFAEACPGEYLRPAGSWLRRRGWETELPYGFSLEKLEILNDAIFSSVSIAETVAALDEFDFRSPFDRLLEMAAWPDKDFKIARNAFNAHIAKGKKPEQIIKDARKMLEQNSAKPPRLGKWIKMLSVRDAGDHPTEEEQPRKAIDKMRMEEIRAIEQGLGDRVEKGEVERAYRAIDKFCDERDRNNPDIGNIAWFRYRDAGMKGLRHAVEITKFMASVDLDLFDDADESRKIQIRLDELFDAQFARA